MGGQAAGALRRVRRCLDYSHIEACWLHSGYQAPTRPADAPWVLLGCVTRKPGKQRRTSNALDKRREPA